MISSQKRCQSTVVPRCPRRQRGFSMFEMVVYILTASILFAAAFNRYQDFPGEAERANFLAVQAQLNAGINLQMMRTIARGDWSEAPAMEGLNPMDLMLTTPSNYVGVLGVINESTLPRRIWYFDGNSRQLVYLANDAQNLYWINNGNRIPANSVRFRVTSSYGPGQRWEGLVLAPVTPYEWQAVTLQIPEPAR